jgi:hypothetical protein
VARLPLRELSSPITPSHYLVAAGACDVTIGWGDDLMLVPACRRLQHHHRTLQCSSNSAVWWFVGFIV